MHHAYRFGLVALFVILGGLPAASTAQQGNTPTDITISGSYHTTYYGSFDDWDIFPVLLPVINFDPNLRYTERYDLRPAGQIVGQLSGDVSSGDYQIALPTDPAQSLAYDTDGDPSTPSNVKVFIVGTASGMIGRDHVGPYDFLYTRSYRFNANTRIWSGELLIWTDQPRAELPILNGPDNVYYTADDRWVTVYQGWNLLTVTPGDGNNTETLAVAPLGDTVINLTEPAQLEDVDLRHLAYDEAFLTLLDELERTYVFTDYRAVDWDALRAQYAGKAAQVIDPSGFQNLLQDALFSFRDGHLSIAGPGLPPAMFGRLGMDVYPVGNELMVLDVMSTSPVARGSGISPGTVITHVNGQAALAYFDNVPRVIYSGGHISQDQWFRGRLAFRGEPGTAFDISYRLPDGQTNQTTLFTDSVRYVEDEPDLPRPRGVVYHDVLPSGIGHIGVRSFTSARVDDLWDDAMQTMLAEDVPGIIIDLRQNGGGFSGLTNYILGDFIDEDVYVGQEISSLDEDGDGQTDEQPEYYLARAQRFDPARVVVLVSPNCLSACEFAAYGFQWLGATVMGHLPSGGAGGGVGATYLLPGDTRVYGMAVVRREDPQGNVIIEGSGVPLDVRIPLTAEGLASGEDILLQAAQAFLLALD
ncbi:MAG: S41 family peptidase [Anaerolineales bacterium]